MSLQWEIGREGGPGRYRATQSRQTNIAQEYASDRAKWRLMIQLGTCGLTTCTGLQPRRRDKSRQVIWLFGMRCVPLPATCRSARSPSRPWHVILCHNMTVLSPILSKEHRFVSRLDFCNRWDPSARTSLLGFPLRQTGLARPGNQEWKLYWYQLGLNTWLCKKGYGIAFFC